MRANDPSFVVPGLKSEALQAVNNIFHFASDIASEAATSASAVRGSKSGYLAEAYAEETSHFATAGHPTTRAVIAITDAASVLGATNTSVATAAAKVADAAASASFSGTPSPSVYANHKIHSPSSHTTGSSASRLANGQNAYSLQSGLWFEISADAKMIDVDLISRVSVSNLAPVISDKRLWSGNIAVSLLNSWKKLRYELLPPDEYWAVWTDWYEDRLYGQPMDPDLELKKILLPSEDWDEGPAHVNAIIKRLIEEHEGRPQGKLEPADAVPQIPNPLPSPSTYIAHDGTADLMPATAMPVPSNSAETAWEVLTETLSDLEQLCGHNAPTLTASLNRVARALGKSPQDVDVIRCGMSWLELKALAEVTDSNLMGETVAQVKSLAVQLGVFSAQFEDWREFFAQLPDAVPAQGSINEATKLVADLRSNLAESGNLSDPANEQLIEEQLAAIPGTAEFDEAPVPAVETKAGFVRSGLALTRAFAVDVLKESRSLAVKGAAVGLGGSATVLLAQSEIILQLAKTLPAEWAWAEHLIMWLRGLGGA